MPKEITSLKELVAILDENPDGFVVFFQFEEGGPCRAEITRRSSTFHRLPEAVHGQIIPSIGKEVTAQIVFTQSLFARPFPMTAMTFDEEKVAIATAALAESLVERNH